MAKPIARVYGTAVRPGVSKNRHYYSPEMIAEAVQAAQDRLAEGLRPMIMLTHHGADDDGDSTRVVGRLADVQLELDGSATYTAELAGTKHGRDMLTLIDTKGESPPFLRGVSFRGDWIGEPRRVVVEGEVAITADGFEIDGLDFTYKPGITGAGVEAVETIEEDEISETRESAPLRTRIYESVQEARVSTTAITEEAAPPPATAATVTESTPAAQVSYADNGYIGGEKRWPLGSAADARAAYRAITESATARQYTSGQLKRMRQRVTKALREHNTEIADGYLVTRHPITESIAEMYGWDYDDRSGHVYLTLDNGLVTISISSCRIDPHDLDRVARAAMEGACQALAVIDPDMDGDADPLGGESAPAGRPVEAVTKPAGLAEADVPAPQGADHAPTDEEEPAVSEPNTPAVATTPAAPAQPTIPTPAGGITLTAEQFAELLAKVTQPAPAAPAAQELVGAGAPTESAPAAAAPVTEAAPAAPAVLTQADVDRQIQEALAKNRVAIVQELVQSGQLNPGRRGLVATQVTESAPAPAGTYPPNWPTKDGAPKPLHEYTEEEWSKHVAQGMTAPAVLGNRF